MVAFSKATNVFSGALNTLKNSKPYVKIASTLGKTSSDYINDLAYNTFNMSLPASASLYGTMVGIGQGAAYGAAAGAIHGALDKDESVWKSSLKGAAIGGLTGGVAGGYYYNRLASDPSTPWENI